MEGDTNQENQSNSGVENQNQNQNEGNTAGSENNGNQSHKDESGVKTFSQEEVTAISATEKKQGKNSILKLFGCADEKTAKEEAEAFKAWKESQKTDEQKRQEAEQQMKDNASAAEARAIAAENKLAAITAGVSPDSVEDALAIASLKVTEEKSLEKVLEEMKKDQKYSGFFGTSGSSGGTGTGAGHKSNPSDRGNIGKTLALNATKTQVTKSSFFRS